MNFNENQSIYLQITDYVKEQVMLSIWKKEEKVPSVRDLAAELQVNPNTVMRAYDILQQEGVIFNRRGLGNYVSPDAAEKILAARRDQFLQTELPLIFKNMHMLGIGFGDLEKLYEKFMVDNSQR